VPDSQDDDEQTQALLVVDPEDREFVEAAAAENGVRAAEVDQDGFLDPITLSFILLGSSAAIGTVTYLVDKRKGGQVFDLRPGAPRPQYRSKDIDYGLVLIIAVDGKATVEVHEPRGMLGQVIDAIKDIVVSLGKAGIEQIGQSATKAVGDKAKVAVEAVAS